MRLQNWLNIWKIDPFTGGYIYNDPTSIQARIMELREEEYSAISVASYHWNSSAALIKGGKDDGRMR